MNGRRRRAITAIRIWRFRVSGKKAQMLCILRLAILPADQSWAILYIPLRILVVISLLGDVFFEQIPILIAR